MVEFRNIQNEINNLKTTFCGDADMMYLLTVLHGQLVQASTCEWSRGELSEMIKSEYDVLDSGTVDETCELYSDIRNIQDQIIGYFGNE